MQLFKKQYAAHTEIACCLFTFLFVFLINNISFAEDIGEQFKLYPLKVGQYVEYQIIGLQNKNKKDRYRISVTGKRVINGNEYFWIQMDIFSQGKRELSFKALTSWFNQKEFFKKPEAVISEGMLFIFKSSEKLLMSNNGESQYLEVAPEIFLNDSDILKNSFYSDTPYEKNKVDYSKMLIYKNAEPIAVPAGDFKCYHFQVQTQEWEDYQDEGFDLWRSKDVPLLGIVKMEFSKTAYNKKWHYQYSRLLSKSNWLGRIYAYFFIRRPKDNRRDTFLMRLLDYNTASY